jgi:oligopeptide transport system substrate-binding protein
MNKPTILAGLLATTIAAAPVWAQETHPETGETLAEDQTFTWRALDESPSIDPQKVEDVDGSKIARDLFEGLLNQDSEGNLEPGVATEWSSSDDRRTWTFTLREDASWSNGEPVTAGDFVYGWQRAVDPATASEYAWYMQLMKVANAAEIIEGAMEPSELGVRAVDDRTLEVTLTEAVPYFDQMVTHTTAFPAPQAAIEEHGDAWTRPENWVSNGAYVLAEYTPGERLVMEKNPEYWDAENVIIDRVVRLVINDENQALTRWQADEVDWTQIPAGQFPRLEQEYPDAATSVPELCSYYYVFNHSETGHEALKDPRVRQALSLALDRDVIVENIMAGGQPAAYTFTPGATAGYTPPDVELAAMTQAERDEMAKSLMQEAGYDAGDAPTFELIYNTSEAHKKIAIAASQMWKQKLGVETTLANQEWTTYLTARGNQEFDIARAAWCGDYNEASTFVELFTSASEYNDGKYANPEIDALFEEAATSDDPEQQYQEIERLAAEDAALIPIYWYTNAFMLDPTIKGWPYENVQQTGYTKDLYRVAE